MILLTCPKVIEMTMIMHWDGVISMERGGLCIQLLAIQMRCGMRIGSWNILVVVSNGLPAWKVKLAI